jgi:hypothetical protein
MLFKVVQRLCRPYEVVHHYRGPELERLELDIWIPALKIGIEYQGEQHYEALEHWGGEDGLKKRQENDRRKRALCKKLGYTLLEFAYSEELSEDAVAKRLRRHVETPRSPT